MSEPSASGTPGARLLGRRLGDVRSDLAALGFGVSLSGSTSADATVTAISHTGRVTNGSVISVTSRLRSTAPPTTSAPQTSSPATRTPSATPSTSSGSGSGSGNGSGNGSGSGNGNGNGVQIPGLGNGSQGNG